MAQASGNWRILKDHWSAADEAGFSRFVQAIGESNCGSSQSCLRDPANPFRKTDQRFVDIDADCAKWPYLLRAYYAWKNGLPFSYVDGISGSGDEKHSHVGNRPVSRQDFIDRGKGINGPSSMREVIWGVFSGTYRSDASKDEGVLADFYSPAIKPGSVRPGTVIYDTNAHVTIVYKVDADGRIYYMDAHPDFTVTRSVYGGQFGQSPARLGGGLKNWRPQKLVGAKRNGEGHLIGGHIVLSRNADIPDYSLVQYLGTEPNKSGDPLKARFVYDGEEMGLYTYVRMAMSDGTTAYNPLHELRTGMKNLCRDFKDRFYTVNLSTSTGIQDKSHPGNLPEDIFDAWGDWESYATPARDARLREGFADFYQRMEKLITLWQRRDPRIVYEGYNLKADLLKAYDQEAAACDLTYLSSDKHPEKLNLGDMARRAYAMSYDPYDCVELRWGASGDELKSCTQSERKMRWYAAQQRLRQLGEKAPRVAYDLSDLEQLGGKGLKPPPPVDVRALIESMGYQDPLPPPEPGGK